MKENKRWSRIHLLFTFWWIYGLFNVFSLLRMD